MSESKNSAGDVTTDVFIGLGSSKGSRAHAIVTALDRLKSLKHSRLKAVSSLYETSPVDLESGLFLNAVACLRTGLGPHHLLSEMLRIEKEMGRRREREKDGSRMIDLDLLLFGDTRINDDSLTLPHPRMLSRRFVMEPLAEISPELRIPPEDHSARMIARELMERYPEQTVKRLGTVQEILDDCRSRITDR